ncbi:MAG: transporter [Alphaproteobacteria bacterium]|nr:transporter [Alphaproteobacteria bacterium]
MSDLAAIPADIAPRRDAFGQPRGLWVLAGTELWERISFHGMQALLVLYMVGALLLPGHVEHVAGFAAYRFGLETFTGPLSVQALAAQTFGFYVGLVYFTPVLGGAIGDRLIGRRAAVVLGGSLMTAGHFALAFDRSFLIALALLMCGAGLLRGNLSAQVKSLYPDGDRREADAFQLYYVAINIGAFLAPIITGALALFYGWHFGFAFAGFGMLIGLCIYIVGASWLPPEPVRKARTVRAKLTAAERRRVLGLALICPFMICFWIAQTQVWNVYNLWVRDHVELGIGRFQVPVPWLQALDGVSPILVMPIFLALWRRQARMGREPDDLGKIGIGFLIFGAATLWLAGADWVAGTDGRAPLLWAVVFHLVSNSGWLYTVPIALALFATRAPESMRGMMIGANSLSVFVGSVISGRIGGLYEQVSAPAFWSLHAAIVGGGGVALLLFSRSLRRLFASGAE